MPKARNTKAEFASRQAESLRIYGKGYNAKGGMRDRRRSNHPAAGDVKARPAPTVVTTGGGIKVTKTVGGAAARHVRSALEAAAASGNKVQIQATFRNAAGDPRTRRIDRSPMIAQSGALPPPLVAGSQGQAGAGPTGPVQITEAPGAGIDARKLLQYLDDYYDGDVWDFLYDLWEYVYE